MNEDPKLDFLKERLDKARKNTKDTSEDKQKKSSGMAWRIGIELFVAVGVGFFAGKQLDIWIDSKPLFMIILTMLGFAAGIKNVMVLAKKMQDDAEADDAS